MKLREILKGIDYSISGCDNTEVTDIAYDSRKAGEGIAFVCLKGAFADGHKYAMSAWEKGSRIFVCSDEIDVGEDSVIVKVSDTRAALAKMSCNFFRHPSRELAVIGITGTKGKTTVAHIVKSVLEAGGMMTGIIGTVGARFGDMVLPTVNTTPESREMQHYFATMVREHVTHAVIEVSSQALEHNRVQGIDFDVCVFTNLGVDHIGEGEHSSLEEYRCAKRKLFTDYNCKLAVVNSDDEFSAFMTDGVSCPVVTFSMNVSFLTTTLSSADLMSAPA